jgi:hypothetical protein
LKHKESISRLSDALKLYKEGEAVPTVTGEKGYFNIPLIQMSDLLNSNRPSVTGSREYKETDDATQIAAIINKKTSN